MFKILLHIEREVSFEELEEFSKFSRLLKKGDQFSLEPLQEIDPKPEPPSSPVIVPIAPVHTARKHRLFTEVLGTAFAKALNSHPNNSYNLEVLRNNLAWLDCPRDEWVPFKKDDLCDITDCKDKQLAYTLVYSVLKFLGRQPVSTAREVLLPPTMMIWTRKKETEQKEQEEANLKLTGDAHIGFPLHEKVATAVTPPEILFEKLDALDWKHEERHPMTIRKFMEYAGLPFTRGNAIRLGVVARNEFGGLKKDCQTKDGVVFLFPLPKDGKGFANL